jgi:hypothetical protein
MDDTNILLRVRLIRKIRRAEDFGIDASNHRPC